MKSKHRIISLLMAVLMALSCFSLAAVSAFAGTDGDGETIEIGTGLTWTYETVSRRLTISGSGSMNDFSKASPWAEEYGDSLEHVKISEGVTSIGAYAFAGLSKLKIVEIPTTVSKIDPSAFKESYYIQQFDVAQGSKYYSATSDGLFNADKTTIVRKAYVNNETEYAIPETVTTIGGYAFEGSKIRKIKNFNNYSEEYNKSAITTIGKHAFQGSALMSDLFLPATIKKIDDYAFYGCTSITTVYTENQLDYIGDYAFYGCTSLATIKSVYNSVTYVGDQALAECGKLADIYFYGYPAEWAALNVSTGNAQVHYIPSYYIVRYKDNHSGVTGLPENQTASPTNQVTLSTKVPELKGYSFLGWSLDEKAKEADYQPGDTIKISSSITLYAIWEVASYKLIYDANGGSGAPNAVTFDKKTVTQISDKIPVYSPYTFLGWNTDKKATSAKYNAGDNIEVNTIITLYAIWEDNGPYAITYDANGGSGAPAAQTKTKDVDINLSDVIPVRSSRYVFLGWSENKNSTTAEYNPGSVYTKNAKLTLYAVWQDNGPYTISYNANGGTGAPSSGTKNKDVNYTISMAQPQKEGYNFKFWLGNGRTYNPGDTYTENADLELVAQWEKINYSASTTLSVSSKKVTIDYKGKVNIYVTSSNIPDGYRIALYEGESRTPTAFAYSQGSTAVLNYTSGSLTQGTKYIVRVEDPSGEVALNGNALRLSATLDITVNNGFFQRIIAFFKNLFGIENITYIK